MRKWGGPGWVASTVLEAGHPRSRHRQVWLPSGLSLACRPHGLFSVQSHPCYLLLFLQGTNGVGLGPPPPLTASFNLNHIFKVCLSKYSRNLRCWGLGPPCMNFGRTRFSSFTPMSRTCPDIVGLCEGCPLRNAGVRPLQDKQGAVR